MLQPVDPRLHQVAVVVEQRHLVERALLIGDRRHPVGAVVGEQRHPVAEAPLVEQARLLEQEGLEYGAIDGACRAASACAAAASITPTSRM